MPDQIVQLAWRGKHNVSMQFRLDEELANEAAITDFLKLGQSYEAEILHLMDRALRRCDVAVDVGANAGWHTVYMGHIVGERGHVLAFEPGSNTLDRLASNVALNGLFNVTIVDQPASSEAGEVTLWLNSDNSGGNALWDIGDPDANPKSLANPLPIPMQATTVEHELEERGLGVPRLIKIDVEGAEHDVLRGAESLLRWHAVPYIVWELGFLPKMGSSQEAIREYMYGFGYHTWILYPDGSLPKLVPPGCMISSGFVVNLLFASIPDVDALWTIETFDQTKLNRTVGEFRDAAS